jgi:hypothetical protein
MNTENFRKLVDELDGWGKLDFIHWWKPSDDGLYDPEEIAFKRLFYLIRALLIITNIKRGVSQFFKITA